MIRAFLRASLFALPVSVVHAARATEGDEAGITDPNAECTSYGYAPVTNAVNAGEFPVILMPATLLPNDADANAKWQSIQANIPNIAPKGTNAGDFSGVNYPSTDPDCWWTWGQCTTSKRPGIQPDIASMPEPQTLGYGFDDGPNCGHNVFYDYLTQQNQKATMYYIGSNVMNFPLEAQRAVADGHEVCAHTWSHRYMTSFSSPDAFAELYYSMKAIKLVTGVTPTCWRPPFGDVDDRIRAIAQGLGLRTILWKYDSFDWKFGTANVTADFVDNQYQGLITDAKNGKFATAGAIMLTHELNNFTMSEAIKFHPQLQAVFKNLVPVGVGLNISQPYQELNYTLPSFAQYVSGETTLAADPAAISAAQAAKAATATSSQPTPSSTSPASQTNTATSVSSTAPSSTPSTHTSGANALRLGSVSTVLLGFVGAVLLGSS